MTKAAKIHKTKNFKGSYCKRPKVRKPVVQKLKDRKVFKLEDTKVQKSVELKQ